MNAAWGDWPETLAVCAAVGLLQMAGLAVYVAMRAQRDVVAAADRSARLRAMFGLEGDRDVR